MSPALAYTGDMSELTGSQKVEYIFDYVKSRYISQIDKREPIFIEYKELSDLGCPQEITAAFDILKKEYGLGYHIDAFQESVDEGYLYYDYSVELPEELKNSLDEAERQIYRLQKPLYEFKFINQRVIVVNLETKRAFHLKTLRDYSGPNQFLAYVTNPDNNYTIQKGDLPNTAESFPKLLSNLNLTGPVRNAFFPKASSMMATLVPVITRQHLSECFIDEEEIESQLDSLDLTKNY